MEKQCFTIVYELNHEPEVNKYRNVILEDKANNKIYMYDSCGAWTEATAAFIPGSNQTLVWDETTRTLTISGGNTVNIPSDNTDNQILTYNPNTNELSISNGNTVDIQTIDPVMLPYQGNFIVSGGVITPATGLQVNVSPIDYADGGKRKSTGTIPVQVLQPSVDTYLVLDRMSGTIEQIDVSYNDNPPLLPAGRSWIGWVRTNATSVTNTNDIRLMRHRGIAARFEASNTFLAPNDSYTRVPYNTLGSNGYRFGAPFRGSMGNPGVHRIPVTGIYDVSAMVYMGAWAGTYRTMMNVFVNGSSYQLISHEASSGQRGQSGSAAASSTPQRIVGSGQLYLQEGDLLDIRVYHRVGSTRTFGAEAGYLTISLKEG